MRPMTPEAFRNALAALGLSQRGAAKLWGVNERTVRTWASEGPPKLVAVLLGTRRVKPSPPFDARECDWRAGQKSIDRDE